MLGGTSFICADCGVEVSTYQSEFPIDRDGQMIYQRIFIKHRIAGEGAPCIGSRKVAYPAPLDGKPQPELAGTHCLIHGEEFNHLGKCDRCIDDMILLPVTERAGETLNI